MFLLDVDFPHVHHMAPAQRLNELGTANQNGLLK